MIYTDDEIEMVRACLQRKRQEERGFHFWFATMRGERVLLLRPVRKDKEGAALKRAAYAARKAFVSEFGAAPSLVTGGWARNADEGLSFFTKKDLPQFEREVRALAREHGMQRLLGSTLDVVDDPTEAGTTGRDAKQRSGEDKKADKVAKAVTADPWEGVGEGSAAQLDRMVDRLATEYGKLDGVDPGDVPRKLDADEKAAFSAYTKKRSAAVEQARERLSGVLGVAAELEKARKERQETRVLGCRAVVAELEAIVQRAKEVPDPLDLDGRNPPTFDELLALGLVGLDATWEAVQEEAGRRLKAAQDDLTAAEATPLTAAEVEEAIQKEVEALQGEAEQLKTHEAALGGDSPDARLLAAVDRVLVQNEIDRVDEQLRTASAAIVHADEQGGSSRSERAERERLLAKLARLRAVLDPGREATNAEVLHADLGRKERALEDSVPKLRKRLEVGLPEEIDDVFSELPDELLGIEELANGAKRLQSLHDELIEAGSFIGTCEADLRSAVEKREGVFAELQKLNEAFAAGGDATALAAATKKADDAAREEQIARGDLAGAEDEGRTIRAARDYRRDKLEAAARAWLKTHESDTGEDAVKAVAGVRKLLDRLDSLRSDLDKTARSLDEQQTELARVRKDRRRLALGLARPRALEQATAAAKRVAAALAGTDVTPYHEITAAGVKTALGEGEYTKLLAAAKDLQRHLSAAIETGAPVESIGEVYAASGMPETWYPPRLREQEANWLAVKEVLSGRKPKGLTKAEKITKQVQSKLGATAKGAGGAGSVMFDGVEATTDKTFAAWVDFVQSVVTVAWAGYEKGTQKRADDDPKDPIAQMLAMEEAVQAANALSSAGVTLTASALKVALVTVAKEALPGVAIMEDAVGLANALAEASQAYLRSARDAEIRARAEDRGHRLDKALGRVARRSSRLATRRQVAAATRLLDLAADLGGVVPGGGTAVKAGIKVVSGGIKLGKAFGEQVVDRREAAQVRETLRLARAGDPVAREEIFAFSGRYATALVAVLAEEGDPVALSVLNHRQVTPEMVRRSSAAVIRRFLMRDLQESERPQTWGDLLQDVKDLVNDVGAGISALKKQASALATRIADEVVAGISAATTPDWMNARLNGVSDALHAIPAPGSLVARLERADERYAAMHNDFVDGKAPGGLEDLQAAYTELRDAKTGLDEAHEKYEALGDRLVELASKMGSYSAGGSRWPAGLKRVAGLLDYYQRNLATLAEGTITPRPETMKAPSHERDYSDASLREHSESEHSQSELSSSEDTEDSEHPAHDE